MPTVHESSSYKGITLSSFVKMLFCCVRPPTSAHNIYTVMNREPRTPVALDPHTGNEHRRRHCSPTVPLPVTSGTSCNDAAFGRPKWSATSKQVGDAGDRVGFQSPQRLLRPVHKEIEDRHCTTNRQCQAAQSCYIREWISSCRKVEWSCSLRDEPLRLRQFVLMRDSRRVGKRLTHSTACCHCNGRIPYGRRKGKEMNSSTTITGSYLYRAHT